MPGSAGEAIGPAEMQMMGMMGGAGDGGDAAPLTGHGFLLDKGVFTTIDHPDAVDETAVVGITGAADINDRGQIVGYYDGMAGIGQCASQGARPSASGSVSTDE
jgi:hypothetical protein